MKTLLSVILIFMALSAISQDAELANIPVTTDSEQALGYFNEGMDAMEDVLLVKATEKFNQASELDPDFIMPQVMLALGSLYNNDMDNFKLHANKVLKSRAPLTSPEKLIQEAMKKLVENPQADVSDYGKKLVKMYPESVMAHELLANFQNLSKDYEGALKTYQSALKITRKPAPIYNAMGYAYMSLNQMDKAKESFDKYLKAAPNSANVYDSMGDYYAKVNDLEQAQQSYMKAYKMDTTNFLISQKKAEKIKEQVAQK
ncbi:MAG: tetratricopeptide repeat protein [Candidatus Saccharibacteria bacterium]